MGNYSAIYINEILVKVKEITCALTTSVIWTTRLTKTSEFSSPFNGENHICWNTLVTSSWKKLTQKESKREYGSYISLSLLIPLDMAVTCSRVEKIYFLNVWSSSTTNWGHKNHTKEPNKKLYQVPLSKIVSTDKQWYEENINFLNTCNLINKKINIFL